MAQEQHPMRRPQASMQVSESGLPMPTPQEEWAALGMAFNGLCKVGLALTVGFSVAATFCKLMESGKVKIPAGTVDTLARQILMTNLQAAVTDPNGDAE